MDTWKENTIRLIEEMDLDMVVEESARKFQVEELCLKEV